MLIALVLLSRQYVSVEMRGKQCNTFYLDVHCTMKALHVGLDKDYLCFPEG